MKKLQLFSLISLILTLGHLLAPVALAHPLGNFTLNHYIGLHITRRAVVIDYVLDMAEIPAFQEIVTFDANGNGLADPTEAAAYHPTQCQALQPDLDLRFEGQPPVLQLTASSIEFPAGAGGLPTLRLTCTFQVPLALTGSSVELAFKNNIFPERLGWREIVVSSDGVSLAGELTGMTHSISQRLTLYPNDLLSRPLDQRQVVLSLTPANLSTNPIAAVFGDNQPSQLTTDRNDAFTRLITTENLSPMAFLLALAVAFAWGAAHALTPGHGKTIVAAYLVGSRGTTRHALFLGLTTALTHTAGVFVLGFLTLFASEFILPEQFYPWLGVASGLLVVGLGWSLFKGRLQQFTNPPALDHTHENGDLYNHIHNHGGHTHSHLPPGAAGSSLTWRSLLALGVSGGLIPCPSALVVMLSAIALQRIGFGLALIVAFSLGLAGVLTAIGIVWVHAGRLFGRIPIGSSLFRIVPALSALFMVILGLGIVLQSLAQTGMLPAQMTSAISLVAARAGVLF